MVTAISTSAATNNTSGASSMATTSAAEQQDRFMKLLVAQMKNQDPLNPMDNAQMTSQIAQINTVSGIEKLNTTVESLLASFNALQAQSATQLPGRSVLVAGNSMSLSNGAAQGGIDLASAADAVKVDILDGAGAVVNSINLGKSPAGTRSFSWDGRRSDGQSAPDGAYRIRVTAIASGQPVAATALMAVKVQSVSQSASGVTVDLGAAGTAAYGDIKSFL